VPNEIIAFLYKSYLNFTQETHYVPITFQITTTQ